MLLEDNMDGNITSFLRLKTALRQNTVRMEIGLAISLTVCRGDHQLVCRLDIGLSRGECN